jgi:hypothetical protein
MSELINKWLVEVLINKTNDTLKHILKWKQKFMPQCNGFT